MPIHNDYGYGEYTLEKFTCYKEFLLKYLSIVRSIQQRKWSWTEKYFHYMDLNAGPGIINFGVPLVPAGTIGSPLIFKQLADRMRVNYLAEFFEANPESSEQLKNNLLREITIGDFINETRCHCADHNELIRQYLTRHKKWAFGLVYHDPNNGDISFDTLEHISTLRPRYDILINFPAALFKRRPEHFRDEKLLTDCIDGIEKSRWFIKDLMDGDRHQWTFLFGTNYEGMTPIKKIGFRDVNDPVGQQTFQKVNASKNIRKKKGQPPLPGLTTATGNT